MAAPSSRQCEHVKPDGERCRAAAMHGSAYCFFHDPEQADKRRGAQQAGGRERCRPMLIASPAGEEAPLERVQDVAELLSDTIHQVRRGDLEPRVANAVGYLAGTLLKALQAGELEERVEQLERLLDHQPEPQPTLWDDQAPGAPAPDSSLDAEDAA